MSTNVLKFSKMHGAGNDFIVLDTIHQTVPCTTEVMQFLAHRQFGIGADQILLVEPSTIADFKYRIFNADGSEVEHCGNGARCFVRFVHEQRLSHKNPITAEIATGILTLEETHEGVQVAMGSVTFEPSLVGFDSKNLPMRSKGKLLEWQLELSEQAPVWLSVAGISNPHAVLQVSDCLNAPVERVGKVIESHPRFKNRVNVGFMEIQSPHQIILRVFERGAGETLACGTGACAAVAIGIEQGLLKSPVQVQMRGGILTVFWDGTHLSMIGPAQTVYEGTITLPVDLVPCKNAL